MGLWVVHPGVLTAKEAATLDLSGTRLVVLSACESGCGESPTGEGVFGLRRALRLAGAQALVLSLWQVSDAGTELLMSRFYRLRAEGCTDAAALRAARLEMLGEERWEHPFYWAAFVFIGAP